MDEIKKVQVTEDSQTIYINGKQTEVDCDECAYNTNIQIKSTPNIEIEDEDVVDIQIDEAFPFMVTGASAKSIEDRDVLIDGGKVSSNQMSIGLETVIAAGEGITNHSMLTSRNISDQHSIDSITDLRDELNQIKAVKQIYSSQSGLSEFRKWDDNNPDGNDRSGYFVTIKNGENVDICSATSDVYGVSITRASAGFIGNQNEYDKCDDFSYAVVGIVGAMRVRTDGQARVGDYVVPNAFGEATLSEGEYGYKVLSTGTYSSYDYVTIAFTPQMDALSRLQGGASGSGNLSDIIIQIENLDKIANDALNNSQLAIDTSNMSQEEIEDIITEINNSLGTNAQNAQTAIQEVMKTVNQASKTASDAVESAQEMKQEAIDVAEGAITEARDAVSRATQLSETMQPIVSWKSEDGLQSGVAGFVAQSNEDHTTLASIISGSDESGTSLAAIIQRLDENGAVIQHLVSHADKYSVGSCSVSDGLTYEEAKQLLIDEHIYVCTSEHTEVMSGADHEEIQFARPDGITYSYIWDPNTYIWKQDAVVRTNPTYADGTEVGELWLCFEDVEKRDNNDVVVDTYLAGTLYRWFGSNWVAVATIDGSDKGRVLTSITQTANDIKMVVNNYGDEGSTFQQNLEGIFTTVQNSDNYISAIEQTAESIRAGTYSPNDKSSYLELLAADTSAGLSAVASGRFHIVYQSFSDEAPDVYDGWNKYSRAPEWDDENQIFVFDDNFIDNANGTYYFYSDDKTKYCSVTKNGYDIYTIGNKATSLIDSRISETEAILSGTVEYAKENSEAFAGIVAQADANSARIETVASYQYHTLFYTLEKEPIVYGEYRYNNPPEWDAVTGAYKFNVADRAENGIYYLADGHGSTYCKVTSTGDGQPRYEIYGFAGSYLSSITQGADEDGAYIQSMVVDMERYNIGNFSPSYGMSYDDAVSTIPKGTIYVPTVAHSENLIRDDVVIIEGGTEHLTAGTLEERESDNDVVRLNVPPLEVLGTEEMQTYDFEVDGSYTYGYTWTGMGWEKGAQVSMSTEYFEYDETNNQFDLWYCVKDVIHVNPHGADDVYRAGTLYAWRDGKWFAITTTQDSLLSRSISLVRQTAESYSIEISDMKGNFSKYEQTIDRISQTVADAAGSIGSLTVTTDGVVGEVYNRTGNSATLKAQADSTQAVMDLMISGVYHKLEQPLTNNVPNPYNNGNKYSTRPEWSAALNSFVFYENSISGDGMYYFFDSNHKHYCKVVGEQYEVYTIGTLSTAGTDAHITSEYAAINTLAAYGDDETSTIAGLRNLALEGKAQVELIASLDTNKLLGVVSIAGYELPEGTKRYSEKPIYNSSREVFVFDGTKQDNNGLYYHKQKGQFGKLIYSNSDGHIGSGVCTGYELYEHNNTSTAGLIETVLENQASVGLFVENGAEGEKVVKGGILIEAINGYSYAKIYGDKVDIKGITAFSSESDGTTVIDGDYITTGTIKSKDYRYDSGNFSQDGTSFDLTNGSIISKNFAIDTIGNLYLNGTITATDAKIKGGLSVGSTDEEYNFVVDPDGNVTVRGTLDATILKFNGKSVLTESDKVSADYLELKGLTIKNNEGETTFRIDQYGNVTIKGDVDMGTTSSISWDDIDGKPSDIVYADGYSTYIDGSLLKTETVVASKLMGGKIGLLHDYSDPNYDTTWGGYISISSADSAPYAVDLKSNGALRLEAQNGNLYLCAQNQNQTFSNFILVYPDSGNIIIGNSDAVGAFCPASDAIKLNNGAYQGYDLGASWSQWANIYVASGTISSSDRNKKNNIEYNPELYDDFFFDLKPTQYKFINGQSNRYHLGFISQDVEQALVDNNLTSLDFAGFIKSPIYEDDGVTIKDYSYGLRYSEFIALNTHMIQKLYKRIKGLEEKIAQMEEQKYG